MAAGALFPWQHSLRYNGQRLDRVHYNGLHQFRILRRRKGRALELDPSERLASSIRETLRQGRMRKGLSLGQLARRSGVSKSMLSAIETGRSTPTILTLWHV